MENQNLRCSLLLEFYGPLLSERQREVLTLHIDKDCSLAEIGELLKISRQAVSDAVSKGRLALDLYENKLGLLTRFNSSKVKLEKVSEMIKNNEFKTKVIAEIESIIDNL